MEMLNDKERKIMVDLPVELTGIVSKRQRFINLDVLIGRLKIIHVMK